MRAMTDLFQSPDAARIVPLPDADVSYRDSLDLGLSAGHLLQALIAETPWRQEEVSLWGKTFLQPRLIAWYGDRDCVYSYSGVRLQPLPWTPLLFDMKVRVEAAAATRFNSVLLNYYRDNNDSMGMHSDDEKELGPAPVIASVSLGAARTFVLKRKGGADAKPFRMPLASGSLLVMSGETQQNYKHGIAKVRRSLPPRVNLTFRAIVTDR